MKIHVSKKKDEDGSCIVLEIIKQFKYMYFRYFPLMLDQKAFFVYGFSENGFYLPFANIICI